MSKLYTALAVCSVIYVFEGSLLMNKNKIEKTKKSINKLDDNSGNSSVLDTHMAIMYKLSNMDGDITDATIEEINSNKK
jgi:hypothetical protein